MNKLELAQEMNRHMVSDKRVNETVYFKLDDTKEEWMTEVVRTVHGDKMPDDYTYEFISDALDMICDLDTEDDFEERLYEMEADVYTHDLTKWLHARADHVYYLTEVLEEFGDGIKDGFQLLVAAQLQHKQEVARDLWDALDEYVTEDKD